MTENQPIEIVHWRLDAWFPNLSSKTQEKLKIYRDELMNANKLISLISVKTIFAADAIHFADSIIACQTIQEADPSIHEMYDLGSGNGFPGLIYALLFPTVKVILVESDLKKADFLKRMVDILALSNATVRSIALETLPANSVKNCMARGLSNISKSILLARKIVPQGGSFYHLKGDSWSGEVSGIPTQLCSVWTPTLVKLYKLPIGEVKFAIIKTEKIA